MVLCTRLLACLFTVAAVTSEDIVFFVPCNTQRKKVYISTGSWESLMSVKDPRNLQDSVYFINVRSIIEASNSVFMYAATVFFCESNLFCIATSRAPLILSFCDTFFCFDAWKSTSGISASISILTFLRLQSGWRTQFEVRIFVYVACKSATLRTMPSSEVSSTKLINSISAATSSAVSRSSHSGSTFLRTCVTLCDQHLLWYWTSMACASVGFSAVLSLIRYASFLLFSIAECKWRLAPVVRQLESGSRLIPILSQKKHTSELYGADCERVKLLELAEEKGLGNLEDSIICFSYDLRAHCIVFTWVALI